MVLELLSRHEHKRSDDVSSSSTGLAPPPIHEYAIALLRPNADGVVGLKEGTSAMQGATPITTLLSLVSRVNATTLIRLK
jgi:hypothetical protein